MPEPAAPPQPSDVPSMIFEKFLKELEASGETTESLAVLRKTLLEDKSFTERALRMGVFGEAPPQ